jgi:DNA-binding NtrC family response regulator
MENLGKVLVVDDNEDVLFALNLLLEPYAEKIRVAKTPEKIDFFMKEYLPDIILLDMNFRKDAISGQEGFEWLEKILKTDKDAVVILMTAYSDTEKAVRAIKSGATDFITKPWENEKLLATLSSGIKLRRSRKEVDTLEEQVAVLANGKTPLPQIIGESEAICRIFSTAEKLGSTDANVLLLGENGTGKDVLAGEIHRMSDRSLRPMVCVDAGAITETLFESELFGHVKGAFTDAHTDHVGKFEQANGGTLFLDEIGNIPLHLQAKLLRALQNRCITRVGDDKSIPVDIRLICATNKDLKQMVANGEFRQDLYYRINTFELHLPALRERTDEILPLAEMFVNKFAEKYRRNVKGISADAAEVLKGHFWSGNIRELSNCIEKAVILSENELLTAADIQIVPARTSGSIEVSSTDTLEETEEKAIRAAMAKFGGNLSMVAKSLEISRPTLYAKLKKYNI